ncbi:5-formyltetrahydrofolate cyclo-ligase [Kroppenstedtia eburnea]|uniref:5-formyltetrahydrofolate cyclo-ligase n=1 Tax=Kroppenstedtia eburnea TaxID=714067 RepID=A0A1N7P284_9BACL|nr:5-formyltetrahydrofolate cyclo-ligase [Kroppenstedtia eburnea]QKI80884.1 5-formyltetrahydrofolate cyclo-ligase [Kroppenstedtia eburnea]SIT04664.1 5-formyltetrahydrofolate cyclo-ligase [Kroppenstedtia eburnea]
MGAEKDELRTRLLSLREGMDPAVARRESAAVCGVLGADPVYQEAEKILFYMPHKGEVDLRPLMELGWREGKQVVLPRSLPRTRELELYRIESFRDVAQGTYGIREPVPTAGNRVAPEEVELVVVPGVGFDKAGYRLGYGGGYYDRFFAGPGGDAIRIGAAYSFQWVSTVYPEPHDQPLNGVATPSGICKVERQGDTWRDQ